MAEEKETVILETKVEGKEDVEGLSQAVNDNKKQVEANNKSTTELSKSQTRLAKASNKVKTGAQNAGRGFRVLGGAMKAAGIGLIVAVVAKLTQAFSQNQAVMDGVNKIFKTISIVFQEITTAISSSFQEVSKMNGGFKSTVAVVTGLMNIALAPLKLLFDSIKLTIQSAMLAWENSFLGDGDTKKIKELNKEIKNTKESIAETAKETVDSAKDVGKNFSGMITEVSDFAEKATDKVKDVNIKAAKESANAIVELRKEVELAEVQLQGLTLQYQNQAETLRQQRDDTRLSIEERIKANEKLGEVLRKQTQEELALAQKKLNLAQKELALNPQNIENQKALQQAKNGILEVEERINSQRSEQRINEAALQREREENIAKLREIGMNEVEREKLEAEQKLEEQKKLINKTVANEKRKNELLKKAKQEYNNQIDQIENERKAEKQEQEIEEFNKELENDKLQYQQKLDLLKQQQQAILESEALTEKKRTKLHKENTEAREKLQQQEIENQKEKEKAQKEALANAAVEIGKALGLGKEVAIAQALFSTYESAQKSYNSLAGIPVVGPALGVAAATAATVNGLKRVQAIKSTKTPNAGGGGSSQGGSASAGAGSQAPPQQPDFNLVGNSQSSNITEPITEPNEEDRRAIVVSREVTSGQEANRNAEQESSF